MVEPWAGAALLEREELCSVLLTPWSAVVD